MKIFAAKTFNADYQEWIDLVIGEDGMCVSCNAFSTEEEVDYDMIEGTKIKLNDMFGEWSKMYNIPMNEMKYEIVVVEKNDPEFLKAKELNEKKVARQANHLFRLIDKISLHYSLIKISVANMLKIN